MPFIPDKTKRIIIQPKEEEFGGVIDIGSGLLKGIASTIRGASSLGEKLITGIGRAITPKSLESKFGFEKKPMTSAEKSIPEAAVKPISKAESIGYYAEQIGEFLLPSSKIAKLEKGLSSLGRAATESAITAGQTAIQKGNIDDNNIKTAAIIGAMFPLAGGTLSRIKKSFGRGLEKTGEKIEQTVIRPTSKDLKDGFKVGNVFKYKLTGGLNDILAKANQKMNQLGKELEEKLSDTAISVNLSDIFERTQKRLSGDKALQFGNIKSIDNTIENLLDEISEVAKDGIVNLPTAQKIKRGAGTKGAWVFGMVDKDARAIEKVYSTFYNEIKKEIENVAPAGIKEINKQLSELIPIQNAVIRRLPVAERNNAISLTDSIGLFSSIFSPYALALVGVNRLSKSGKFANILVKAGEHLKKDIPKSAIGQRIFGTGQK